MISGIVSKIATTYINVSGSDSSSVEQTSSVFGK